MQAVTGLERRKSVVSTAFMVGRKYPQITLAFTDFESGENKLPASVAQARFVRYVMTDDLVPAVLPQTGRFCGPHLRRICSTTWSASIWKQNRKAGLAYL